MRTFNPLFMPLVLPYLVVRTAFRLIFGQRSVNWFFHKAGLFSTWDYLAKLGIPYSVRSWIDVRTRFRFERNVVETLSKLHGNVFIDVGANMGYYSTLLSRNFETVMAFEPDTENFQLLVDAIRVGKLHNIRACRKAVSDSDGFAKLYRAGVRIGHSLEPYGDDAGLTVPSVRLDSLISDRVDLLKIDVEGGEWRVLDGAERNIRAHKIVRMMIEIHDLNRRRELEDLLRDSGYSIVWLDAYHAYAVVMDRKTV